MSSKISYVVLVPLGTSTLHDGTTRDNIEIGQEIAEILAKGGSVVLPMWQGWQVGVINNDTGEVTLVGKTK